MRDYDAIVVGAGNAGLMAAATLQRGGLRTLLLERHNVPGGTGTSFRRGRFEFEVALHQLSGIGLDGQPGPLLQELDRIGVADKIEFVREHELYRSIVPGSHDVVVPVGWSEVVDALEAAFPGNRSRLEKLFDLVRNVTIWQVAAMRGLPADQLGDVLFANGLRSLKAVLDEHFDDPALKNVLGIYWTYSGMPSGRMPFQDWALIFFAYVEFGPAHVKGGSQAMSAAILDSFLEAGGEVLFNTGVDRILTDAHGVTGVVTEDGDAVSAQHIVSNASLPTTVAMLDDPPTALTDNLAKRRVGVSAFLLHLGCDLDDDAVFANWGTLEPARSVCMSSYDVTPIGFSPAGASHASLLTLAYEHVWDKVEPADYHRQKFAYAEGLLDVAEIMTPGIRDAIAGSICSTDRAPPTTSSSTSRGSHQPVALALRRRRRRRDHRDGAGPKLPHEARPPASRRPRRQRRSARSGLPLRRVQPVPGSCPQGRGARGRRGQATSV